MSERFKARDRVVMEVIRNGRMIQQEESDDLIVNTGKAAMAGLLNGVITTPFRYVAIGTLATSLSATDTALQGEVARKLADTIDRVTTSVTNDTARLIAEFTATANWNIVESGVFDSSAGGVMLARQTRAVISLVTNDVLRVTWQIQVS